jgi:predicted metal-dependent peptidase
MVERLALHVHRGTRAIERMVEFAPSTGGLALWVRHQDLPDEATGPPVVTDGNALYYGAGFDRVPLAEQAGLVAHEVLHIALRHPQRFLQLRQLLGDVDLQLFNICADAIVNSTLAHVSWLKLPKSAVLLDGLLSAALRVNQTIEKSLLEWDVERLYRAIDDRQTGTAGGGRQNERPSSGGSGTSRAGAGRPQARADGPRSAQVRALGAEQPVDLLPQADHRGAPEAEADEVRAWSERVLRAHASDGMHSMLRTLIADVARVRTPWEQVLRTQMARSLAPKLDVSWSRPARSYIANQGRAGPHRRLPWTPGLRSSKAVPRLVLIVDVSGSICGKLLQRFAREIEAITRRLEAGLVLVVGDDRVRRVEHFEPGLPDLGRFEFNGGGGTDFTPLLEEADRHKPDLAVILTDLDGPAHRRPRYPVIWAVPEEHAGMAHPFGRKLTLT